MKASVLVVDDDIKYLALVGKSLKRGGFEVLTASDGADVPELLARRSVDVVVMDLQMPGMNGWELLRNLGRPAGAATPTPPGGGGRPKIVVVSGRDEDETAAFVRRLGADAYLTKPCWGSQILATVRGVLEG